MKLKPLNSELGSSKTFIETEFTEKQKKIIYPGIFRIFWDLPEPNRMEIDRIHSGTDGRTDIWQIIIFDDFFLCNF